MTNSNYIQWLETMIVGCDDLGGMEREKAIYQNCLKKARNLGQTLPIQRVSGSFIDMVVDNEFQTDLADYVNEHMYKRDFIHNGYKGTYKDWLFKNDR